MSVRAVVVAHRESLAAEGIAAALARYPALVLVGIATSAAETERCAEQADAVAIDARIPGRRPASARMRRRGVRVVVIGGGDAGRGRRGRRRRRGRRDGRAPRVGARARRAAAGSRAERAVAA